MMVHSRPELDFDRQYSLPLDNQKIDFGPGMRPPEENLWTHQLAGGERAELFDYKPFK